MLKIIGVGYPRTGTNSLMTALNELGFPCYHMYELLDNPENKDHLDFWVNVSLAKPGKKFNWDSVYSNYTAAVDSPAACVWREHLEAYPDAKVILTLHPKGPEEWYDSFYQTIYLLGDKWYFKIYNSIIPKFRKYSVIHKVLILQRMFKGTIGNKSKAVALYNQHIEEVKKAVPAERLLIYSVDQGWEPLCEFLGVPMPSIPFPKTNDRRSIKKRIYTPIVILCLILTALLISILYAR